MANIPKHIAIVMDGNGRWAKKRFLPRIFGHRAGLEAVRNIVTHCLEKKISVLSLFAFSSENWRRPTQEVSYLMDLFVMGLEREIKALHKNNIQLRFIGNRSHFNKKLLNTIENAESLTNNNDGMTLLIAADYGGKWDLAQAFQKINQKIQLGFLKTEEVTEQVIASHLSCSDLPDPDLFIRTSGEVRISNFMLWQLAYAELYFTETLWPDFDIKELDNALAHYAKRDRRFGERINTKEGLNA